LYFTFTPPLSEILDPPLTAMLAYVQRNQMNSSSAEGYRCGSNQLTELSTRVIKW